MYALSFERKVRILVSWKNLFKNLADQTLSCLYKLLICLEEIEFFVFGFFFHLFRNTLNINLLQFNWFDYVKFWLINESTKSSFHRKLAYKARRAHICMVETFFSDFKPSFVRVPVIIFKIKVVKSFHGNIPLIWTQKVRESWRILWNMRRSKWRTYFRIKHDVARRLWEFPVKGRLWILVNQSKLIVADSIKLQ